jgi:hypothetical protein
VVSQTEREVIAMRSSSNSPAGLESLPWRHSDWQRPNDAAQQPPSVLRGNILPNTNPGFAKRLRIVSRRIT